MLKLNYILESLIFASGKPIEIKKLAKVCDCDEKKVSESLDQLNREYKKSARGIRLVLNSNEVQMTTASEYSNIVKKLVSNELQEDLSKVSLESLTIIAYKGPITRYDLEAIRGVNCLYILRNLLIRGLIEKQQNLKNSRAAYYQVSAKFLRHLGIAKISELPNYEENKTQIKAPEIKKSEEKLLEN